MAIARVNGATPSRCRQTSFGWESDCPSRPRIPAHADAAGFHGKLLIRARANAAGAPGAAREVTLHQPAAVGNARRFRSIVFGLFFTMKGATRTCRRERGTATPSDTPGARALGQAHSRIRVQ